MPYLAALAAASRAAPRPAGAATLRVRAMRLRANQEVGTIALALFSVLAGGPDSTCGPGCMAGLELQCGSRWRFRVRKHDAGPPLQRGWLASEQEASVLLGSSFRLVWALLAPLGAESARLNLVLAMPEQMRASELSTCFISEAPATPKNSTAPWRDPRLHNAVEARQPGPTSADPHLLTPSRSWTAGDTSCYLQEPVRSTAPEPLELAWTAKRAI